MNGTTIVVALAASFGATVAALSAYLVSRRQTRGTIRTSDAASLWKESQDMRLELRDEVVRLRQDLQVLRDQIAGLETEVRRCKQLLGRRGAS